jgi:hypothetical protein
MIALNKTKDWDCGQFLTAFFKNYPDPNLQVKADRSLKKLLARKIPLSGKPGGWAAGIIYAVANEGRLPCGMPGLLNKECEEFFHVTMGTIYKRAAKIGQLLDL